MPYMLQKLIGYIYLNNESLIGRDNTPIPTGEVVRLIGYVNGDNNNLIGNNIESQYGSFDKSFN